MEKRSRQGRLKPFLISFASPASCSAGVPMKMVRKHNFMIVKRWNMCFWKLAGNQSAHVEMLFSPHLSRLSHRGNSYRPGLRLTFTLPHLESVARVKKLVFTKPYQTKPCLSSFDNIWGEKLPNIFTLGGQLVAEFWFSAGQNKLLCFYIFTV